MYGGHHGLVNTEVILNNSGYRGDTVSGTAGVAYNFASAFQFIFIHTQNDGQSIIGMLSFGRGADDDFFSSGGNMSLSQLWFYEESG